MDFKLLKGTAKQYPPETVIFEEGDPSDFMYVVTSGKVVTYKRVIQRATHVLHTLGVGEYFGEMSLTTGARRSESAKTIAKTDVIQIDKNGLHRLLKEEPEFGLSVMKQMAERLAKTSETLIYSELELALSRRKPSRFQNDYSEKTLFVVTGSFNLENKKKVLKTANAIEWSEDVDVVASLFKPGKIENDIIYIVAVDNFKTLVTIISRFNDLVKWDFSPVLPINTEEIVS